MTADDSWQVDVIGVGFGPSNLAVAIAAHERHGDTAAGVGLSVKFLERQPHFGWHRGMLLEDTTMQVSFLKDLVTMRDPRSDFSFLRYLQVVGRLSDFINHKTVFPSREEFHGYLAWAAERLDPLVEYGCDVVDILPVPVDGLVRHVEVRAVTANGGTRSYLARNVVLATGLHPRMPPGVARSARVWHSSEFLHRLPELDREAMRRVVVVGAGQSAAEVTDHLHRWCRAAEVHSVHGHYGYRASDDNPFANQVFDPSAVDEFYQATAGVKESILHHHAGTNYSVVDVDLLEDLHRRSYNEKVRGARRLHFHRMTSVAEVVEVAGTVRLGLECLLTGETRSLDADLVVFATGYRPADPWELLDGVRAYCVKDAQGRPLIARDHGVVTTEDFRCGLYVQGPATEHSHGLSSSLLSLAALRAGELVQTLVVSTDRHRDR